MRLGLFFGLLYAAAVFSSREWRATLRLTLTRTPWWQIARGMFDAFPSSHWRGIARIVGVPFAAYFAALVVTLWALFVFGIEIVFSPRAVYCSLVRLTRHCRGWFTQPPNHTPPYAAALAMPRPEPPSLVDAVSRIRIAR
jgi:hypothetical protein